jgi:hypothetical protein
LGVTFTDTNPDNHFGSDPRIRIIKLTNGTDNNAAPGPLIPVGNPVTFTYIVSNTGNVPLSNVTVTDDRGLVPAFQGGDANGNGLLEAGETWTYTAATVATPGRYTNLGTAAGTAPLGDGRTVTAIDPDNHFGSAPGINIIKLTNGTDNNSPTGPLVPVGSPVTFTYIVTNTGNVPLSNVTVTDNRGLIPAFQGGDANGNGLLEAGETWTYTAATVATPGPYTNLGTAAGTAPLGDGRTVTAIDPDNHFGSNAHIRIIKLTNGADNNAAPGPLIPVGNPVTFTYIVSNTGNVPLSNVTVTDDRGLVPAFQGGDSNGNGVLDLTETWTYTAATVATPGPYTNLGTAAGTAPAGDGRTATAIDPDNHFGSNAHIRIIKLTNGTNNDTSPGLEVPTGSDVTFTYIVTNTGNVPLSNVTVTDDHGVVPAFQGGDANGNGVLDLTETWTYTAATIATPGPYTNVGTATGTPPVGSSVSATDPEHHFADPPGISIIKLTNGTDHNAPPGLLIPVGSPVTFTYIVTNTGVPPVSDVTVTDDRGLIPAFQGGDANGNGLLEVGETWIYTAVTTATAGPYTNVGTVIGTPPIGPRLIDRDPEYHFGVSPGVRIIKLTNGQDANTAPGPEVDVGSTVTFTYLVTDTGNSALSNVAVRDDNGTPGTSADDFTPTLVGGDTNGNGLLDVGETWTYTATRTATPGPYENFGTVTAVDEAGVLVANIDVSHHLGLAPPTVITFDRRGIHRQPTELVLNFGVALDPARAQDVSNYTVILDGGDGRIGTRDDRLIPVGSATYNAATRSVTLRLARQVNLRRLAQLTVRGTPPGGLTDASGTLLDGDRDGRPGGNFVANFQGIGVATLDRQGRVTTEPSTGGTPNANRFYPLVFRPSPGAVDQLLTRGNPLGRHHARRSGARLRP